MHKIGNSNGLGITFRDDEKVALTHDALKIQPVLDRFNSLQAGSGNLWMDQDKLYQVVTGSG